MIDYKVKLEFSDGKSLIEVINSEDENSVYKQIKQRMESGWFKYQEKATVTFVRSDTITGIEITDVEEEKRLREEEYQKHEQAMLNLKF